MAGIIFCAMIGLIITLRQGHPILQEEPYRIENLYQNPFVDYSGKEVSTLFVHEGRTLINQEKIIRVAERNPALHCL